MRELRMGAVGVFVLGIASVCLAEQIKIGLVGYVESIDDPYSLLKNGVHQGDSITGFYLYDLNPDAYVYYAGAYKYTSTPYGMSLTLGGLTFQTDPTNVDFMISIVNGIPSGGSGDNYIVESYNNLFLSNDVHIERILWQLTDYSYTAISSEELPDVPPDLSAWQYDNFTVSGGRGGTPPCFDEIFQINGHVTSVYLIPEPATLLLLGTGGLLLRKRR